MEFTKEEISLCKQIAKKHRKEIARGDYYVGWRDKKNRQVLALSHEVFTFESLIPLWTMSDCLEFLRKKDFLYIEISSPGVDELFGENWQVITKHKDTPTDCSIAYVIQYANTPLEACLKAVLAVLEEGKGDERE